MPDDPGHTLEISWKDNQDNDGGTELTIKVDGKATADRKRYSSDKLGEAQQAIEEAVTEAKSKFVNKKPSNQVDV